MKQHIFSIGLNVGQTEPAGQLRNTLRALCSIGEVHDVAVGASEWAGVPERFLQARVTLDAVGAPADRAWLAYDAAALLARSLAQECVAVRMVDARADKWRLISGNGDVALGAGLAEFPVILGANASAPDLKQWDDACARSVAEGIAPAAVNVPGKPDTIGHSSVQPWSAGEFFPAVLARCEKDSEYAGHELIIGGWCERYASYDDAAAVARYVCQNGRINAARYAEVCHE